MPNNKKIVELKIYIYNFSHIGVAFLPVWHCVRHISQTNIILCLNSVSSYTSVTLLSAILWVFGHQSLKWTNIRLEHYRFGGCNASVNKKKSWILFSSYFYHVIFTLRRITIQILKEKSGLKKKLISVIICLKISATLMYVQPLVTDILVTK